MNKNHLILIAIIIISLLSAVNISYCEKKILIVTSIETLSLIVREIGGSKVEIEVLIPEGIEPHAIQFTSKMVKIARRASLLVLTGHFSFEENLIEQVNKPYVALEDYIENGLKLLEIPGTGLNLHGYWLYPENAIAIAKAIADKLKSIDPKNGDYYENNLMKFINKINNLLNYLNNSIIESYGLKWIKVVIAFPAAQYVAAILKMKIGAFLSKGAGVLVGGSDLIRIEEKLRRGEYKLIIAPDIIAETQIGKYVEQIAFDTGAPIAYIKTIGGGELNSYTELISYNVGVIIGSLIAGQYSAKMFSETSGLTWLEILLIIIIAILSIVLTIETWIIIGRV